MSYLKITLCTLLLACAPLVASAQTAPNFESLPVVSAQALEAMLTGKIFSATTANGTVWRNDFKSNGYVFVNIAGKNGGRRSFSRPWKAKDGFLCVYDIEVEDCKPARLDGTILMLQLTQTGEIIRYIEQ